MLQTQSVVILKDNSKILKVKIINLFLKKKVKFKDVFIGVTKISKSNRIKSGSLEKFLIVSTKKKTNLFSGKSKNSDQNCCVLIKDKKTMELNSTRFLGIFFSELKTIENQKIKILINKCI